MKKFLSGTSRRLFAFLILLGVGAFAAFAQLPTATILGTVRDGTGAVVPEAAVTVRNLDTGLTRAERSGANGSYRAVALPVGTYEVRVEQAGFRTEVRSGVTLTVGQEAVINFALQVGAIEQTVEVTAEAPLVNTTSGSLGGLVDARQVADLPLNGRNYVDLTLLQPGVVEHRPNNRSLSGAGTWFSASGAPPRSNYYLLDGTPMNGNQDMSAASVGSNTLGVEGIREWRVVTNSASAEYGMRMGSQMTIVSKGGSNNFHGSLFEYLRNSALDARNFFDYKTAVADWRLPPFRRNQYGGSFGGPIKKDRAFFFATYEGLKDRLGLSTVSNAIGAGCHGPGNATITNTACPQLGPATPSVTISPVIAPLLALYPTPNLPSTTAGRPPDRYTFPSTRTTDEQYGQARADYVISNSDSLFVRYTGDGAERIEPLDYPQFKRVGVTRMQFLTASDVHTFGSAMVGTFRFSTSKVWSVEDSPSGLSGPQYTFLPGEEMGQITIGGITNLGADGRTPRRNALDLFTWSGDLFYTKGRHSLKFGTLANHSRPDYVRGGQGARGTVTFADVAAFLQGRTTSYDGKTFGSSSIREYHHSSFGFYLQDDLRVRSNLTLNLGLRYEFQTEFTEVKGRGSSLRDIRRDTAFTLGPAFLNPSLKNFGPRFGFAWDVRGNGRTAVRGGFGLLYDIGAWGGQLSFVSNGSLPFSSMSSVTTPSTLTGLPLFFPAAAVGRSVRTMDYHVQNPHMLHYNFTVERQLPWEMGLSLAYAGSRGINLATSWPSNPPIPQKLPDGRFFWVGNEPRPNPAWDTISQQTAGVNSWYNSLQFVVSKLLSRGLQLQSSYTWAKLIDEKLGIAADDNGGSANITTSVLPRELNRGLADWSLAHSWRFSSTYRLPELPGLGGVPAKVLNGWWMSGILTAQTGLPFMVTTSGDRSRSRGGANLPSLRPGVDMGNITSGTSAGCAGVPAGQELGGSERYFNPCAFSLPEIGTLGNVGRNTLIAPGVANLDFSLVKDTALGFLGESGKLEFRTEIFNILNRANFGRPSAAVFSATTETALAAAGRITGTNTTSRQIQFALKVIW